MLSLEDRFWAKVDKSGECWIWTAAKKHDGYGIIGVGGRAGGVIRAHRLSAKWAGMDIEGKQVLHRCDNPACVRPSHLFLGTNEENVADKVRKGRQARLRGAAHPNAKLNAEQVLAIRIRRAMGHPLAVLAREFGVAESTISKAAVGDNWGHVS